MQVDYGQFQLSIEKRRELPGDQLSIRLAGNNVVRSIANRLMREDRDEVSDCLPEAANASDWPISIESD